jgi:hypothetical protein
MSGTATAMICYRYAFKVSPTLKNICAYLYEVEGTTVDVIVDDIHCDENLQLPGVKVVDICAEPCFRFFLNPLFRMDKKKRFLRTVKSRIGGYSRVLVVDFLALEMLGSIGHDLSNVIFISLEGTEYIQQYDKAYAADLLSRCAFCIVQSRERASAINNYLSSSIIFEYLPVSCRYQALNRTPGRGRLELIYSGYLAEWACLSELMAAYQHSRSYEISSLLLQGHSFGTNNYVARVKREAACIPRVAVDTSYYSDAAHAQLLAEYDAGLAFYRNIHGTDNFENLILSSGKIASYLWNGLAVLTNVDSEYSTKPPFVFVDLNDDTILRNALEGIAADRELFMNAAHEMANKLYNFDIYMAVVYARMQSLYPQVRLQ